MFRNVLLRVAIMTASIAVMGASSEGHLLLVRKRSRYFDCYPGEPPLDLEDPWQRLSLDALYFGAEPRVSRLRIRAQSHPPIWEGRRRY